MLPRVQYRVLRPTLGAVALLAAVGTTASCDKIALVAEVVRRTATGDSPVALTARVTPILASQSVDRETIPSQPLQQAGADRRGGPE